MLKQQILKSVFLRQNAIFFIGSLIVSVLNYAYYPALSRLLSIEQYGEIQVLISIFMQLTLLMTVLTQVTVSIVANYSDKHKQQQVMFELEKLALYTGGVVIILGIILSSPVSQALKFDSAWPFFVLLLAFFSTIPFTFRSAYLRGRQQFGTVSVANIIAAGSKIIASMAFIGFGLGVAGAIGGVIAAQLLAFGFTILRARKHGFGRPVGSSWRTLPDIKLLLPELRYTAFVLSVSLSTTLLFSLDVIAVKYFFDAETAGGYAGVATIAKIIFFLTASVAQVMMPTLKDHLPKAEHRLTLMKSLIMVGVLGGVTTALFALAPGPTVRLLMGTTYEAYAHLLPLLSVALFVISIVNLIASYYIALRRYKLTFPILAGLLATILLLGYRHSSLDAIVQNLLLGATATIISIVIWRFTQYSLRSSS